MGSNLTAIDEEFSFMRAIAESGRIDGLEGRQCLSFLDAEDRAFEIAEMTIAKALESNGISPDQYTINKDPIGNLYVTLYGKDPSTTVLTGSHLDSVQNGGDYDGVAGVAAGIGTLIAMAKKQTIPEINFTTVVWRSEESTCTSMACLGSQIAAGIISSETFYRLRHSIPGVSCMLKDRLGQKRSEDVTRQIDSPWLKDGILHIGGTSSSGEKMKIVLAHEIHIEQSDVLEKGGYDLGVVQAIGGSRRYLLTGSQETFQQSVLENSQEKPLKLLKIKIEGRAGHTGGTPPNSTENFNGDLRTWNRSDALVSSAKALSQILQKESVNLVSLEVAEGCEGGYTTIPYSQIITLCVPQGFDQTEIDSVLEDIERKQQVRTSSVNHEIEPGEQVKIFDTKEAQKVLSIPLEIEESSREMANRSPDIAQSSIRLTVTDFNLNASGLQAKVDMRHVSDVLAAEAEQRIEDCIQRVRHSLLGPLPELRKTSSTTHQPLNEDIGMKASRIAGRIGMKVTQLPSFPGHDIGSVAKAGAPSGMIFIAHDGKSHRPDEMMTRESYEKARKVQAALFAEYLGL